MKMWRVFLLGISILIILSVTFGDFLLNRSSNFGMAQKITVGISLFPIVAALLPERWIQCIWQSLRKTAQILSQKFVSLLVILQQKYIPEILLLCLVVFVNFYHSFRSEFPLGYAGLYVLMSEKINLFSWGFPATVPFYGPGGIPYAYPPIGFIVESFFNNVFHVSAFTYLKIAPPFFGILYSAGFYMLVFRITKSRPKAVLSVFFASTMLLVYQLHITSAGMVRGLALAFMLWGLAWVWQTFQESSLSWKPVLLAGLFFGLTTLTHLTYALFFTLTLCVFAFMSTEKKYTRRLLYFICIAVVGALVSALWWAPLISRYGIGILQGVFSSHRGLGFLNMLYHPLKTIETAITVFSQWEGAYWPGLALMGIAYAFMRRRWLIPIWFLFTFLFIGEGDRFLMLISAVLIADMFWDIILLLWQNNPSKGNILPYLAGILLVLAFEWTSSFRQITLLKPALSQSLLDVSAWIKQQPAENDYLLISGNDFHDEAEWIPYLSQHSPAIGHWGAEWIGNYRKQLDYWEGLGICSRSQSFSCLDSLLEQANVQPKYYIIPNSLFYMQDVLSVDPAWDTTLSTDEYVIFEKK